jgi:RNA polymerase sigma factor (sigma-70 family)
MTTLALTAPAISRVKSVQLLSPASSIKAMTLQARQDLSDEDLISAICSRAEWAIELLYQRYHRFAYSLAYHILHESSAAEDVVQETFLSIWYKAPSYQRQHGSVHRWLQAIVHHRAIDRVRAAAHRDYQWTSLQLEDEQDPPSQRPELWEEIWHGEQQALIRAALEQLPAEQRQVIEMAYFGGYTHAEIADRWQIPLGTVKGRMRLGLQKMKRILQEQGLDASNI